MNLPEVRLPQGECVATMLFGRLVDLEKINLILDEFILVGVCVC